MPTPRPPAAGSGAGSSVGGGGAGGGGGGATVPTPRPPVSSCSALCPDTLDCSVVPETSTETVRQRLSSTTNHMAAALLDHMAPVFEPFEMRGLVSASYVSPKPRIRSPLDAHPWLLQLPLNCLRGDPLEQYSRERERERERESHQEEPLTRLPSTSLTHQPHSRRSRRTGPRAHVQDDLHALVTLTLLRRRALRSCRSPTPAQTVARTR